MNHIKLTNRKSHWIGCLMLMSHLAFAGSMSSSIEPATTSRLLENNFYVGGDIGVANLQNNESHVVNPESHQLGAVSIVGGGFVGYDYAISERALLGIEGFIDANALHMSIAHNNFSYKMDSTYNGGIRLLPSYALTPNTLSHLIVGYSNGHFNIHDNGVYGTVNTSFNKSGFQTGLGFTTTLPPYLLLRVDALYTTYGHQETTGQGLSGSGNAYQYYTNQFSTLAGELSLIYKFG